jgi:hypothetical protein
MNTKAQDEVQFRETNKQDEQHHGGFTAGTLVHTKEGLKPIETLQVGDWILSFSSNQIRPKHVRTEEELIFRQITKVFENTTQPLYHLTVFNLASGKKETLWTNADQPIWCKGLGWVPVARMEQAGDVLENWRFRNLIVYRCIEESKIAPLYNLEIDEFQTYYAGEEGIWVHDNSKSNSI